MIVAGIDIGSRGAKSVIMKDNSVISSFIGDTGPESVKTSYIAIEQVLKGTGLKLENLEYVVATGYGRVLVPFAKENISEISCHARGVNWYFPTVRTILDMGGQDCKAIRLDQEGKVTNFIMNDKCAGGTGRFLEMIADVLQIPLSQVGSIALESKNSVPFNTICAVFAKSDAITYLRKGVPKSDILSGLNEAIATRCLNLLKRVSITADFSITGGVSKNSGMVAKLTGKVGLKPLLCPDPQLAGAIGAALFAQDRLKGIGAREDMKVHYGYSDGTGNYYITIDSGKCNSCGKCVSACPATVFEMMHSNGSQPKAAVKEMMRKKLAIVCPGHLVCSQEHKDNCHSICEKNIISHTW
jgi:predicted CoA-substrate-specific enzyme activase